MTAVDAVRFAQAFNRLAVASRLSPAEADETMQRVYWEGLSDLPVDVVELAADRLSRTAEWFPKLAEWREAASAARLSQVLTLPAGREEPWEEECQACRDTGWEPKRCYPGTQANCGRPRCVTGGEYVPEHDYVYRCSCRETNRTFHRRHRVPSGREPYNS